MIKAIETRYKGCRFRSRLEARWAVFFDSLGLAWEYEPEGFDLGDAGWYLPDFRVTSTGTSSVSWYEVKPTHAHDDGKMRALERSLMGNGGSNFMVLAGDPFDCLGDVPALRVCPKCGNILDAAAETFGDQHHCMAEAVFYCFSCDETDHEHDEGMCGIRSHTLQGWTELTHGRPLLWKAIVNRAAARARSARFEHGECP